MSELEKCPVCEGTGFGGLCRACNGDGRTEQSVDALRARIRELEARIDGLLPIGEDDEYGPHTSPDNCPIWYDHCWCTTGALRENIGRAERAEARIRELEDAARWIPVSERLPDPFERVEVTVRCVRPETTHPDRVVMICEWSGGAHWDKDDGFPLYQGYKVLAWRPLPAPYDPEHSNG